MFWSATEFGPRGGNAVVGYLESPAQCGSGDPIITSEGSAPSTQIRCFCGIQLANHSHTYQPEVRILSTLFSENRA